MVIQPTPPCIVPRIMWFGWSRTIWPTNNHSNGKSGAPSAPKMQPGCHQSDSQQTPPHIHLWSSDDLSAYCLHKEWCPYWQKASNDNPKLKVRINWIPTTGIENDPANAWSLGVFLFPTTPARRKKCHEGCQSCKRHQTNRRKHHNSMATLGYPTKKIAAK